MDVASLNTVLLVQAQGSLAGAARVLELDASSVSRTVASVENELGIRLFHRTTRRLTATEEGELYLSRLAPLIEEMEAAREDAVGQRSRPTGLLRMTASVAFSCEMIVPIYRTSNSTTRTSRSICRAAIQTSVSLRMASTWPSDWPRRQRAIWFPPG